jgi:hypothetical protein
MSDNSYRFSAPPVVQTTNRVNTSRQAPTNIKSRSSLRYANVIAAGATLQVPCAGTQFYFRTATSELNVRPSGGVFSQYGAGEGLQLDESNAFSMLEIANAQAMPVVFELFVGFQGFIDNKLILAQSLYPQVAYPTYPIANAATSVAINDLSATKFTDINGGQWYALARICIHISNLDNGVTLLLQKAGSVIANGPAVAGIQPVTTYRWEASGNYSLNNGGGNINAVVADIYTVIAA